VAFKIKFTNFNVIVELTSDPSVVNWAISNGASNWLIISNASARIGMIELFQRSIAMGIAVQDSWSYLAGANNHLEIIDFLIASNMISWVSAVKGAAYGGKVKLLKYLINGAHLSEDIWKKVASEGAKGNNIGIVYLAIENYNYFNWYKIAHFAAKNNNIELLEMAIKRGAHNWAQIASDFGYSGNPEIFDKAKRYIIDSYIWEQIADNAAESGNLVIINMALDYGATNYASIAVKAAEKGYTMIVERVLRFVSDRISLNLIAKAAIRGGYLDILKLLSIEDWGPLVILAGESEYVEIYKYCERMLKIQKWEEIALTAVKEGNLNVVVTAIGEGAQNYTLIINKANDLGYYYIANYINNSRPTD